VFIIGWPACIYTGEAISRARDAPPNLRHIGFGRHVGCGTSIGEARRIITAYLSVASQVVEYVVQAHQYDLVLGLQIVVKLSKALHLLLLQLVGILYRPIR
jgi:hypothetical protein